jgi:hypothetical protein
MADNDTPEDTGPGPDVDRRSFLGRVIGGAALIGAGTVLGSTPANAQTTDQDPVDSANCGRGRPNHRRSGLNDSDPVDQAGRGRGGVPNCRGRRRSGITDQDPRDGAGLGRGRPNRRRTGLNDSDPVDNAGWGRGGG